MKARSYEGWEHDNAHQALATWADAWRRAVGPAAFTPGLAFAMHIGKEAVDLAPGMSKVELLRLFSAAGDDAQCVCGRSVDGRALGEFSVGRAA